MFAFNLDEKSPWKGRIKLTGKKDTLSEDGIIAHKTFATPIIDYTYNDVDNYKIRNILMNNQAINDDYDNEKYIFWALYKKERMDIIYKILLNYFKAIQEILPEDWGNTKSILTKSTGYNAIMKLFKGVYLKCSKMKDFSVDNMYFILEPLGDLKGKITSENYGGSGMASTNNLYKDMLDKIDLLKES